MRCDHVLDVRLRGALFHDDDHGFLRSVLCLLAAVVSLTKKPRGPQAVLGVCVLGNLSDRLRTPSGPATLKKVVARVLNRK